MRPCKKLLGILVLLGAVLLSPGAQTGADYPLIASTNPFADDLYRQHQELLDRSHRLLALLVSQKSPRESRYAESYLNQLLIFQYRPREGESINQVAADFSLDPDTLASLNDVERSAYFQKRETLLIPTLPGLYLRTEGGNELNRRLLEARTEDALFFPLVLRLDGKTVNYRFYPGQSFSGAERLYFVSPPFRSPLDHPWDITSAFGYRDHPVTGLWEFHDGIDVRSPTGNPVYAIEKGYVFSTTELDNYGIIIIIKHEGGYESRYAHLNRVTVKRGDAIRRGQVIAYTGNTGLSTGPHLHFEIRRDDRPVDPVKLVAQGSR